VQCPSNQRVGKPIDTITLKALLAVPLTRVNATAYNFCPDPTCPTVYYSTPDAPSFTEADLREKVYQKHVADEDVFVCYCFRHTSASIRAELVQTGQTGVVAAVTAGIQAGQCACDIRNPQGSCCLGNVRRLVQQIQAEADMNCPENVEP
jgi:hypothetical protein